MLAGWRSPKPPACKLNLAMERCRLSPTSGSVWVPRGELWAAAECRCISATAALGRAVAVATAARVLGADCDRRLKGRFSFCGLFCALNCRFGARAALSVRMFQIHFISLERRPPRAATRGPLSRLSLCEEKERPGPGGPAAPGGVGRARPAPVRCAASRVSQNFTEQVALKPYNQKRLQ